MRFFGNLIFAIMLCGNHLNSEAHCGRGVEQHQVQWLERDLDQGLLDFKSGTLAPRSSH